MNECQRCCLVGLSCAGGLQWVLWNLHDVGRLVFSDCFFFVLFAAFIESFVVTVTLLLMPVC